MEIFKSLAQDVGICIAYTESAPSAGEDERFDDVVRNLQPYRNARVVACFCEGMTVRGLLKATKRLNVSGEFLFVGRYDYQCLFEYYLMFILNASEKQNILLTVR